jgi:ribosomal protection tetracycline resistance protein
MWGVVRGILNLGILAHVDAGKTTLTERLLYAAGVIDEPGSVDAGTTQTDSLALERERGITIRSAVVSFRVGGITVNLIDTPGHPDFIAEVERALSVLDGVVLVVSAVEGVQPQTCILWRALQRLRVPTLIFVNKIDRRGAGYERVHDDIAARLTPAIIPMGSVTRLGTPEAGFAEYAVAGSRLAEMLAEHDDEILAAYLDSTAALPGDRLREKLAVQVRAALVHPVYFGSASTGAGVDALTRGCADLVPTAEPETAGPVRGRVFKIERAPAGEKVAYARLFSGAIAVRDRVRFGQGRDGKVTAIGVFAHGGAIRSDKVTAGHIAKLSGLAEAQVGDMIGTAPDGAAEHYFAPPTLETAVVARDRRDKARLRAALAQLAEQDPLINVRQDDIRQEIYLSLYGEVQKQVIEATLAAEYGLKAGFRETTPICVERPIRTGTAEEILHAPDNPFLATLGIRIDPAPAGSGTRFRLDVGHQAVPLYIYKNMDAFAAAMEYYITGTLRQGLRGWPVTDCTVTLIRSQYSVADGPPSTRGPLSSAQDFRKLTPLVVMAALRRAGTVVCEPVHHFVLDTPASTINALLPALAKLHAVPEVTATEGSWCTLEGDIPVARLHELRQQIPPLTRGEGVMEASFDHYQPVPGPGPARPRTDDNPLNREEYLQRVTRRKILGRPEVTPKPKPNSLEPGPITWIEDVLSVKSSPTYTVSAVKVFEAPLSPASSYKVTVQPRGTFTEFTVSFATARSTTL